VDALHARLVRTLVEPEHEQATGAIGRSRWRAHVPGLAERGAVHRPAGRDRAIGEQARGAEAAERRTAPLAEPDEGHATRAVGRGREEVLWGRCGADGIAVTDPTGARRSREHDECEQRDRERGDPARGGTHRGASGKGGSRPVHTRGPPTCYAEGARP